MRVCPFGPTCCEHRSQGRQVPRPGRIIPGRRSWRSAQRAVTCSMPADNSGRADGYHLPAMCTVLPDVLCRHRRADCSRGRRPAGRVLRSRSSPRAARDLAAGTPLQLHSPVPYIMSGLHPAHPGSGPCPDWPGDAEACGAPRGGVDAGHAMSVLGVGTSRLSTPGCVSGVLRLAPGRGLASVVTRLGQTHPTPEGDHAWVRRPGHSGVTRRLARGVLSAIQPQPRLMFYPVHC